MSEHNDVYAFLGHAAAVARDAQLIAAVRSAAPPSNDPEEEQLDDPTKESLKEVTIRQGLRLGENQAIVDAACRQLPGQAATILELGAQLVDAISQGSPAPLVDFDATCRRIKAATYQPDQPVPQDNNGGSTGGRPASSEVAQRREKVLASIKAGKKRGETVSELGITNSEYDDDRKALKATGKLD